jgi:vacuolar protein sorting-associated protein 13A/C
VLSTLLLFGHALYTDMAQLITALPPALGWMVARPSETPQRAQKVYVRWLNIQPMRVLLSCRSVAGGNGFEVVYGDHVHGEAAMGVLNSASAMVANIDRASVRLKALVLDNVFTPMPTLLAMVGASYKEQVLLQLYKLLFSFEVRRTPPRHMPPRSAPPPQRATPSPPLRMRPPGASCAACRP